MQIKSFWLWETPRIIPEPIVIIDAWTATTNLSIILSKSPKRLVLVNEKNYQKAQVFYKNSLLIGESHQLPKDKFDISNYPSDIYQADFKDKSLLFMTINGTRAFEKFKDKKNVIAAAFNNLEAAAGFLRKYKKATFIMSGDRGHKVLEDEVCARVYKAELENTKYDWQVIKEKMMRLGRAYYSWPEDKEKKGLHFIFKRSAYNIVPKAIINKEGFIEISKFNND